MADEVATTPAAAPVETGTAISADTSAASTTPADSGSSVNTSTEATEAQAAKAATPEIDVDALLSHEKVQARIQAEADRLAQKRLAKERQKLEHQRLSKAAEDPSLALEYAQERKAELDQAVNAESAANARAQAVNAALQRKWANKEWAEDYNAVVKANAEEADQIYSRDPDGYLDWVQDKISDLRVERRVEKALKEKLPVVARAEAANMTNQALQSVPVPPTGNGASGDMALLSRVKDMSASEYAANRDKIMAAARTRWGG
jgi:hypothetical protein